MPARGGDFQRAASKELTVQLREICVSASCTIGLQVWSAVAAVACYGETGRRGTFAGRPI
jgi:hypothetical protein